jgi:hypothetical protein
MASDDFVPEIVRYLVEEHKVESTRSMLLRVRKLN